MRKLILLLVLGLPACSSLPELPGMAPKYTGPHSACSVSVSFASYGAGIDSASYARVQEYFRTANDKVADVQVNKWGREGEKTLCIQARQASDAPRIFRDIASLVPPVADRGPITIRANDDLEFVSQPPPTMVAPR